MRLRNRQFNSDGSGWMRRRYVTVEFWNRWRKPRRERYADGTTAVFFGVGRVTWRVITIGWGADADADVDRPIGSDQKGM